MPQIIRMNRSPDHEKHLSTTHRLVVAGNVTFLSIAHDSSDYGPHMMWKGYGMFFGPMMMIVFIAVAVIVAVYSTPCSLVRKFC